MRKIQPSLAVAFRAGELLADVVGAVVGAGDLFAEGVVVVAGNDLADTKTTGQNGTVD
ncbi:MAG: hypothetical protein ABIR33_03040 [Pyrinomonadaceae bacterium]